MPFVTARYMNGSEPVSFALRNRSNRFQAALQILREIVRMLEPDGNPQEPVTDPHLRPRFRREALMRRRRRVCDQRFRVPEIVRDADQPERVREAERRRRARKRAWCRRLSSAFARAHIADDPCGMGRALSSRLSFPPENPRVLPRSTASFRRVAEASRFLSTAPTH